MKSPWSTRLPWLFVAFISGIAWLSPAFGVPLVFSRQPAILNTCDYDGGSRTNAGYDGGHLFPAFNYGSAAVRISYREANLTAGTSDLFDKSTHFVAAEGGTYSAIGSTGQVGEQWLAQNPGGESQVFFNTTQGGRYVDQLVGDVANESKVGYQSLTPSIQLQISKDAELLNGGTFQGVNWHFFQSPMTGLGGPSQPLLNALQQNGINVIIH